MLFQALGSGTWDDQSPADVIVTRLFKQSIENNFDLIWDAPGFVSFGNFLDNNTLLYKQVDKDGQIVKLNLSDMSKHVSIESYNWYDIQKITSDRIIFWRAIDEQPQRIETVEYSLTENRIIKQHPDLFFNKLLSQNHAHVYLANDCSNEGCPMIHYNNYIPGKSMILNLDTGMLDLSRFPNKGIG